MIALSCLLVCWQLVPELLIHYENLRGACCVFMASVAGRHYWTGIELGGFVRKRLADRLIRRFVMNGVLVHPLLMFHFKLGFVNDPRICIGYLWHLLIECLFELCLNRAYAASSGWVGHNANLIEPGVKNVLVPDVQSMIFHWSREGNTLSCCRILRVVGIHYKNGYPQLFAAVNEWQHRP